ncbi:hypothetical protein [Caulobacter vibrioides]|uniref:Uncharacterized protein n=1 Tax=Caulobacter vibrioides (strain NA1000 / CB15N) TaxID=565050 RepID=A0A0H3IZK4_CAUVN|nr:hypothetical protein [Caulobacter vibrioides]YP_009020553.1 hypothetical protein CCNA_03981 [Caulobacter vibrioides NA1000]AHI88584.1 hypothetical protein CCNA_03981 [Caulobacter vibrioides NA1000]QXZ51203.1 hypothetical protein KZH45_15130 [Caulobacter vibrioides]
MSSNPAARLARPPAMNGARRSLRPATPWRSLSWFRLCCSLSSAANSDGSASWAR